MDIETLEQIVAIAALVVAIVVFAAMALAGAVGDGVGLPALRHHRKRPT